MMQTLLRLRASRYSFVACDGNSPVIYDLADHRALEGSPLGSGDDLLDLVDGLAVRGEYAVRAGVEGHRDIVRVRNRECAQSAPLH